MSDGEIWSLVQTTDDVDPQLKEKLFAKRCKGCFFGGEIDIVALKIHNLIRNDEKHTDRIFLQRLRELVTIDLFRNFVLGEFLT